MLGRLRQGCGDFTKKHEIADSTDESCHTTYVFRNWPGIKGLKVREGCYLPATEKFLRKINVIDELIVGIEQ